MPTPLTFSGEALTKQPDFHPDDHSPLPIGDMPIRNGRLWIPEHWGKLWGFDFGIGHPFAAVLSAWDRDSDVIYILKTVKMVGQIAEAHAAAIRNIDANAPIAWPHDGIKRDIGAGESIAAQYRKAGLRMLPVHSTWPDGGYSTEAAVMEMDRRMQTGRFRVCADLTDWFEEYRRYHRKDGMIVKVDDDLIAATQKVMMMKRYAKNGPIGFVRAKDREAKRTAAPFDLFTGLPIFD